MNLKIIGRFFLIIGIIGLTYWLTKTFQKTDSTISLDEQSAMIEKQIKQVSKLVVTEGSYSQVYSYKDQKKYFFEAIKFQKKALMVINSEVSIQYDLKKMTYDLDLQNKVLKITSIPKEEIKIYPKFQFYDVEDSFFNPFEGNDYNKITQKVTNKIKQKIASSEMVKNAQNRLLTELSSLFILTNTLGWQIEYQGNIVLQEKQLVIPISDQ